ncbi:hypothetical protein B0I35DRAFT_468130 [Stachybotrys elegans]|uniref:Rhodopsin domain-containing protein n=1 Tax=Stachybotrys elegans TaxID=80388 RepID=A0A8K0SRB3_9HYPO|nr:hypothetical protein B0I35DRAFT_468130 [Stachybotrys elegans]
MASPGMEFPPPIDRDNPGRGPMVVGVTWVFTAMAIIVVGLRFMIRKQRRVPWSWDDWIMLAATVIQTGTQIHTSITLRYGMGKHDYSLYPDEMLNILRHNWAGVPGGTLVSMLARVSITILLIRLFQYVYCVLGIVFIPVPYVQVRPVEALWDFTILDAERWDPRIWLYMAYTFQSLSTFSDLTYALFPTIFIWRLNMPLRQRISLIFVMALSLLTMTFSILKTIWMSSIADATVGEPDVQYSASIQLIWGLLEQSFVIIMGCIPVIRSVLKLDLSSFNLYKLYKSSRQQTSKRYNDASGYENIHADSIKLGPTPIYRDVEELMVGNNGNKMEIRGVQHTRLTIMGGGTQGSHP